MDLRDAIRSPWHRDNPREDHFARLICAFWMVSGGEEMMVGRKEVTPKRVRFSPTLPDRLRIGGEIHAKRTIDLQVNEPRDAGSAHLHRLPGYSAGKVDPHRDRLQRLSHR